MSGTYISAALRQQVLLRAGDRCEYCGISGLMTFGFHIDHIISEKHGGPTTAENLACSCSFCNRYKGSDIASLADNGTLTRLFHPRLDIWEVHFAWVGLVIQARTAVGEATIRLLKLNSPERILERS